MSDYILKTESNLELLIETRQKEVRENLINQYIKCRKEKNMTQAEVLTPDKETVWLTQEQMSLLFCLVVKVFLIFFKVETPC